MKLEIEKRLKILECEIEIVSNWGVLNGKICIKRYLLWFYVFIFIKGFEFIFLRYIFLYLV